MCGSDQSCVTEILETENYCNFSVFALAESVGLTMMSAARCEFRSDVPIFQRKEYRIIQKLA